MRNLLTSVVFLFVVSVCSPSLAGMGVYWQDPIPGVPPFYTSQTETFPPDPLGQTSRVYDDFSLTANYEITDVHWRGGYDRPLHNTVDGFTIAFWNDNGGQPGTQITSQFIAGSANETFVGQEIGLGGGLLDVYDYWVFIDPVPVAANTKTWISIVADLVTSTDDEGFWGWHIGGGGNGTSVQDFDLDPFDGILDPAEGREVVNSDMAFHLTVIPEPASVAVWLVMFTAIGAVVAWAKRRS